MKPLEDQLCLRCEAKGIIKQAETFVKIEALFDMEEEYHPMCKKCKKEWQMEYEEITKALHCII